MTKFFKVKFSGEAVLVCDDIDKVPDMLWHEIICNDDEVLEIDKIVEMTEEEYWKR